MNCEWFEARLDELLDERLPPDGDAELNDHAEICPRCARVLADHRALVEAIESLAWPVVSGDLAGRVMAEVAPEPVSTGATQSVVTASRRSTAANRETVRHRVRRQMVAWVAVAVAATLLVGVGVRQWTIGKESLQTASSKSPGIQGAPLASVRPSPSSVLGMLSVEEVESFAGLIGEQQRTLMEQMSDRLKPMTHPMSAALHALRRTLPRSETPARSS